MSSPDLSTLRLDLRGRRWERRAAGSILLLAASAPWLMEPLSLPFAAAMSIVAAAVVGAGLWRAGWLGGSRRVAAITWRYDGEWQLELESGRALYAELTADTRVTAQFVWLCWRADTKRSVLLAAGDLPQEEMRQLVVRLRLLGGGAPTPAPSTPIA